ncbi:MAG: pyridoxamine 5'-phosphate oxidase family protein [Syntrophales bacterium]|jgi:hypothetical protein|nr:pyridoxamine 5'-phosphate oxidase family protein [Syntrophales bacterium]MDY0043868.1 pyridoxamine 5'-phosphate oxidase family protein [Syntrophales bacterium]
MTLSKYFETVDGLGILSTADSSGKVNSAVYGRPHFIDEETVAFIMAERLTYSNLQSNRSALYIFKESGNKYIGRRLYLTKINESSNEEIIEEIRRKPHYRQDYKKDPGDQKHLVYFHIDRILPLVGSSTL